MKSAYEAVESKLHFIEDGVQYITVYITSSLLRKLYEVLNTKITSRQTLRLPS